MHTDDFVIRANVRDMEKITSAPGWEEFVLSVASQGVCEPITYYVDDDGVNVVYHGNRRVLAARAAGVESIPALRVKKPKEDERVMQQLVTGVQRENLSPIDIALGIVELMDKYGRKQKEIAEKFGKDPSWVSQHVHLLDAIEPIQELVQSGKIPFRVGYEARHFDQEDWERFGPSIKAAKTVRQMQQVRRSVKHARAIDSEAPQQVTHTNIEKPTPEIETEPDDDYIRCARLINMATSSAIAAIKIAEQFELDISDLLQKHKEGIENAKS